MKMKTTAFLVEGEDYYQENGLMIFTSSYHQRRGFCCKNKCRHCPYGQEKKPKRGKNHQ